MLRKSIGLFCLLGLLAICFYVYHYLGTPEYSLYKLGGAIQKKDYETARYYVDEERISDDVSTSIVDISVKETTQQMEQEEKGNPFMGLGTGLIAMMEPQLKRMAEEKVREAVDEVLGKDAALNTGGSSSWGGFSKFRRDKLKLGPVVTVGNTAEVAIENLPQDLPLDMKEFHLRMARIPGSRDWRVVGLPDIGPAFARLLHEAKASPSRGK